MFDLEIHNTNVLNTVPCTYNQQADIHVHCTVITKQLKNGRRL